ncbi:MAG TPA: hypothetical protein VLF09_02490 [Cellvibrio sp.]|nr:hypothetical protein [Cellvibrio sp.]
MTLPLCSPDKGQALSLSILYSRRPIKGKPSINNNGHNDMRKQGRQAQRKTGSDFDKAV